jgi:hypothetical protein
MNKNCDPDALLFLRKYNETGCRLDCDRLLKRRTRRGIR